ncbi:MAG TPA: aminotransferase class V-fold PLP-dependent enzyme [Acidimicrobiales bacterium]|nr:aminotransferase class V-fold PLP-dependent enzyme [Acidimicrobiales bacterium]
MRHYLDHASTSPLRPGVLDAMLPWFDAADPGRVHTEGRMARAALEEAREQVAALLHARPREVVFTSGATEAVNAAVFGATRRHPGPVAVADVEHSAVRDASARLAKTITIAVDGTGRIDPDAIAFDEGLALVHCQWGNHEVGTLQPVEQVIAACREHGVLVHVDAAQAVGRVPVQLGDADLLSVSAHKLGGPKGVGALLVRRGLRLDPLLLGGEQERARRGGLENVAAAVGFGAAAEGIDVAAEQARQQQQTERIFDAAMRISGVVRYGHPTERLPHIACVGIDGVEAEPVLLGLDQAGIAAHSGSSCSSESLEPSPVLQAMGADGERSLRLSVGWSTTDADVYAVVDALPRVVERLRSLRSSG